MKKSKSSPDPEKIEILFEDGGPVKEIIYSVNPLEILDFFKSCYVNTSNKSGFSDIRVITKHNESGPAHITYKQFPHHFKETEIYYIKGYKHREDGPAYIKYNKKGRIINSKWFINDVDISEEVKEWLRENNVRSWFRAKEEVKNLMKIILLDRLTQDLRFSDV